MLAEVAGTVRKHLTPVVKYDILCAWYSRRNATESDEC